MSITINNLQVVPSRFVITREIAIAHLINLAALAGLLLVLTGSLLIQFGVGEQPCPLCLVQRSGLIAMGIGPLLNLVIGLRPAHYAFSILAGCVGGAGSVRQILLHIAAPEDPGYGPAILGYHLYTWAAITGLVGVAGCAFLLMFQAQFIGSDAGVLRRRGILRLVAIAIGVWFATYVVIIAISVLPECGLSQCPDDPPNIAGIGIPGALAVVAAIGAISIAVGYLLNRRLPENPGES